MISMVLVGATTPNGVQPQRELSRGESKKKLLQLS